MSMRFLRKKNKKFFFGKKYYKIVNRRFFILFQKVEISNVNTSNLPILKPEENKKLFEEMKKGSEEARDKLINGNLRLVLSVIQRFRGRGDSIDDLFQIGCVGLIKAIDNFDLSQDVQFSTYRSPNGPSEK